jgi:hypothetical protein
VTGHVLDSFQASFLLKQIHLLEAGSASIISQNTDLMKSILLVPLDGASLCIPRDTKITEKLCFHNEAMLLTLP